MARQPDAGAPVLEVTGLAYRVGPAFGLEGIDFSVHAGEGVAIIGTNGAGKTTLIRLIAGLLRPQHGDVRVCGTGARRWGRVSGHIGYVQQAKELPDGVTVETYLRHQLRLHRADPSRFDELVALADLEGFVHQYVRTLSGGSQRKLHIISAVAHRPDLLILDEPTAGLDPTAQQTLLQMLADLKADGVGVLFASHHRHELDALADAVVVLHRGRQVKDASLDDISRSVRSPRICFEDYADTDPEVLRGWAAGLPATHPAVRAVHESAGGAEVELIDGEHPSALGELVTLAHTCGVRLRSAAYSHATLADIVRSIAGHAGLEKTS